MVHFLKVGWRDGLHFINYQRIKETSSGSQRSNGRANYQISRTVFCVTTILNQMTMSANLRYVKFCSCNSH